MLSLDYRVTANDQAQPRRVSGVGWSDWLADHTIGFLTKAANRL